MSQDPTSQANHLELASTHIDFAWSIDFAQQIITGSATHTLSAKTSGVEEAVYVLDGAWVHRIPEKSNSCLRQFRYSRTHDQEG